MRLSVPATCCLLTIALLGRCEAVTLVSEPSFLPSTNAPLAGSLHVATDQDSRVSVQVEDGRGGWQRDFYHFSTNHSLPLLGFTPDGVHEIAVTVFGRDGSSAAAPQPLTFVSPPLPTNFPTMTVRHSEPARMEPGYTLFIADVLNERRNYIIILDHDGNVVWYSPIRFNDVDVRQLPNGNLWLPDQLNRFIEVDMLGEVVKTWTPPTGYPIDTHDGAFTDRGTILYLSNVIQYVDDFPTSVTDPGAPRASVRVVDNPVVEMSASTGALIHLWSPLAMLDPTRVTYLTYGMGSNIADNEHANAVLEDPADQSIIVSLRNQNAVFKFSRITGELKWILGPPANWSEDLQPYLLTPVGSPFAWNYAQHAPVLTPHGTLLLFDNGNDRASPFDPPVADSDNHSRAVEFLIDETNRQVSQVWDSSWQTHQDRLFTPAVGNVQWLAETRHVLVTYGYVSHVNGARPSAHSSRATLARLIEYTHDPIPQIVFDVSLFDPSNTATNYQGYLVYRARRIPDLYGHPPAPVDHLEVTVTGDAARLWFVADPARRYLVQGSTDLRTWVPLGTPLADESPGGYVYLDPQAGESASRYYRVLTE